MSQAPTPTFTVRHLALMRALAAAIAAVMITFSSDHTAAIGLSVFGGFAILNALIWLLSVWLVFPRDHRAPAVLLALVSFAAGIAASVPAARTPLMMLVVFVAWGVLSGLIELIWGLRTRRTEPGEGRDHVFLGGFSLLFAIVVAVVPVGYQLPYFVKDANGPGFHGVLTGEIIIVGIFGAFAAIVAVYEAISGFSPQRKPVEPAPADGDDNNDAAEATASTGKADA